MGRAGIHQVAVFHPPDPIHIFEFQPEFTIGQDGGGMYTVNPLESGIHGDYPQLAGKCSDTPAPIAAHGAFIAIGVEIAHPELILAA